jgi:hypothetical protein
VWSVESQSTFRRNMLPPSSGSKNKPSKKPAWKRLTSRALLHPEDGGFLRNAGCRLSFQRTTRRYIPEDRTLYFSAHFTDRLAITFGPLCTYRYIYYARIVLSCKAPGQRKSAFLVNIECPRQNTVHKETI